MAIEDMVRTMLNELREIVKTETVVGEPVIAGDITIIPVSKISFGFGAGGGQGKKDDGSSGTGGGGSVQPVAFIVIQKGKAQLLPIEDKSMSIADLLKYAPDVIEKIKAFKDKRKQKKDDEEADSEKEKK
ncbi:MAG: spore germination protein GerW family protein [Gemmatimonadota bacterium]|nr:spore germination protein GerW family protein [Gemmatimonadota bacterium]